MTCSWVRQSLPMFLTRRENCVRLSVWSLLSESAEHLWQRSWCCRKCSARAQSWHLCASCLIGIASVLIRFLRSKNTGGIPPPPIHHRRDSFAPVTSPRWQGLFMGLRFNVYSSNAATVAKTNFVMASHSLARGFFAVHVRLCQEHQ